MDFPKFKDEQMNFPQSKMDKWIFHNQRRWTNEFSIIKDVQMFFTNSTGLRISLKFITYKDIEKKIGTEWRNVMGENIMMIYIHGESSWIL
jgi:hypothetical protein